LEQLNANDATAAFSVLAQAVEIQNRVEEEADKEDEEYRRTHGLPEIKKAEPKP